MHNWYSREGGGGGALGMLVIITDVICRISTRQVPKW